MGEQLLPGIVMSTREGLEALLIIIIMTQYLRGIKHHHLITSVWYGVLISIIFSGALGYGLYRISDHISATYLSTMRETLMSLIAVGCIIALIVWMIRHGRHMRSHITQQTQQHLTRMGIVVVTCIMIAREGVEIALFTFAGDYPAVSIIIGLTIALMIVGIIYQGLYRINLHTLFTLTLGYLIIQAGYLAGYTIHEGLAVFQDRQLLSADSIRLTKIYDFSQTMLDHKIGRIGLPLHILLGRYSKPELLQFVGQYSITVALLIYRYSCTHKHSQS